MFAANASCKQYMSQLLRQTQRLSCLLELSGTDLSSAEPALAALAGVAAIDRVGTYYVATINSCLGMPQDCKVNGQPHNPQLASGCVVSDSRSSGCSAADPGLRSPLDCMRSSVLEQGRFPCLLHIVPHSLERQDPDFCHYFGYRPDMFDVAAGSGHCCSQRYNCHRLAAHTVAGTGRCCIVGCCTGRRHHLVATSAS